MPDVKRPQVLIIDDDFDQLEILTAALEDEFQVSVTTDGLEGYEIACHDHPSVILLDIMMPIGDGWSVLRKLRTNPQTKDTSVVIVSALDRDLVAATLQADVSAVFSKPADLMRLKSTVQRLTAG